MTRSPFALRTALRLLRALSILATTAWFAICEAAAGSIQFDPDKCSTNANGNIMVRLESGLAFSLPPSEYVGSADWPVKNPGPIANPSDPKGCPLNPIVANAFGVQYQSVTPRSPFEPPDHRWRPTQLQIFSFYGPINRQDITLKIFTESCIENPQNFQYGRILEDVSPGLQECRGQSPNKPDGDGPSLLVAKPKAHPESGGRRFGVDCGVAFSSGGSRLCQAAYVIKAGPTISYDFEDAIVPPARMLEFDLQIRAYIAARRAMSYDLEGKGSKNQ